MATATVPYHVYLIPRETIKEAKPETFETFGEVVAYIDEWCKCDAKEPSALVPVIVSIRTDAGKAVTA